MLTVAAMLLSSCVVSKKKYEIAEAGRLAALYSRDSLADLLSMTRTDYAILDELKNSLEADTALLKNSIRNYQQLLATGQDENQKLNANLAKKISELQDREKTIAELQKMITADDGAAQLSAIANQFGVEATFTLEPWKEVEKLTFPLAIPSTINPL